MVIYRKPEKDTRRANQLALTLRTWFFRARRITVGAETSVCIELDADRETVALRTALHMAGFERDGTK